MEQKPRFETDKELDFSLPLGEEHRFRVNVYFQKGAVTGAFRPIPDTIPSLEELGLPEVAANWPCRSRGSSW